MPSVLPDQPDLYAALLQSGAGAEDLEALLAAAPPTVQKRLSQVDQGFLRALLRAGQGREAVPGVTALKRWLGATEVHPVVQPLPDARNARLLRADGSDPVMPEYSDRAFDPWFDAQGLPYGTGPRGEKRSCYASDQFADAASPERRMVHLGIDIFAPALTPVYAPLPGRVRSVTYNADPLDYGHTLILEHDGGGLPFYTLYGHLADTLPDLLQPGDLVEGGQPIAHFGDWHENGGWSPHLHFQIMSDMLEQSGNFFGVGHESLMAIWDDICPDPGLLLRLPEGLRRV